MGEGGGGEEKGKPDTKMERCKSVAQVIIQLCLYTYQFEVS